ncbi:MAG TPA: 9-O-acetylesterase, partial [Verrucomicrobiae bacterium]
SDAGRVGVPVRSSGAFFQQRVTNLNVFSSVRSVTKGVGLAGGYIEFWPTAYNPDNSAHLPNASSLLYDFSDQPSAGDYGSMQVHDLDTAQTIFAFNHWANHTIDLGIGNGPFGNPDWTMAANAASYSRKILQVFVLPEHHGQQP